METAAIGTYITLFNAQNYYGIIKLASLDNRRGSEGANVFGKIFGVTYYKVTASCTFIFASHKKKRKMKFNTHEDCMYVPVWLAVWPR